jgi:hypothetical protein
MPLKRGATVNTKNNEMRSEISFNRRTTPEFVRRLMRSNVAGSRLRWGAIPTATLERLKELTAEHHLSVASGDVLLLDGRWYATHTGLLRLARRSRCAGISVESVPELSDPAVGRWAFKATVYRSAKCRGFVGYGDADSSNVSSLVRGAEMRVAETRAVNRALRKAYGIGLCSVEEIGSTRVPPDTTRAPAIKREPKRANGSAANGNGQPLLRDRLVQLIRKHQLDPVRVRLYAADYCGTPELRLASREKIESFINHLSEQATTNREALVCQLNSYGQKEQGAA